MLCNVMQGQRGSLPSASIMLRQPMQRFSQMQASDIDIYRNEIRKTKNEIVSAGVPDVQLLSWKQCNLIWPTYSTAVLPLSFSYTGIYMKSKQKSSCQSSLPEHPDTTSALNTVPLPAESSLTKPPTGSQNEGHGTPWHLSESSGQRQGVCYCYCSEGPFWPMVDDLHALHVVQKKPCSDPSDCYCAGEVTGRAHWPWARRDWEDD